MKIQITKSNNMVPKSWNGGVTTELAIFPKDSSYKEQNFKFRISTVLPP